MAQELEGTLDRTDFVDVGRAHKGKVRDSYVADGIRTIITTDRQSAFDRILGTIPFKGQALNAVANFWFDATSDIVPNHLLEIPDPNVVRARECNLVALEFVVRAYALFQRGTEVAADRGLILVDTKYEFGVLDDEVVLIDEVHTPDSSRFWYADTYEELFADGKDQRALDARGPRPTPLAMPARGGMRRPALQERVQLRDRGDMVGNQDRLPTSSTRTFDVGSEIIEQDRRSRSRG
jgi:phosphoribosylaminoimidazole-succinocarboxamide synthase